MRIAKTSVSHLADVLYYKLPNCIIDRLSSTLNASMLIDMISNLAFTILTEKEAIMRKGCTGQNNLTLNLLLSF